MQYIQRNLKLRRVREATLVVKIASKVVFLQVSREKCCSHAHAKCLGCHDFDLELTAGLWKRPNCRHAYAIALQSEFDTKGIYLGTFHSQSYLGVYMTKRLMS